VKLTPAGQDLAAKAPNPIQGKMIYGLMKLSENELNIIYESVKRLAEMRSGKLKVTFFRSGVRFSMIIRGIPINLTIRRKMIRVDPYG